MSFVAVDLGASNTRFVSDSGKISVMQNNMVIMPVNTVVDLQPYDDKIDSALEVEIYKEGESEFFPAKALIGQLADRYSSNNDRPSSNQNKHVQRINHISCITAIAISRMMYSLSDKISLFLALPPVEAKTSKEQVTEKFIGTYLVKFPKIGNGIDITFTITDVCCYEESCMAALSYFFKIDGTLKEEARKYLTGNVLSLDIGASTTDLTIIRNGKYIDKSGQTYKIGGNIARDYIIDEVRAQYEFELPLNEADTVMAEGRLQLGNGYKDVSEIVASAKMAYAKSVIANMQNYFRKVDIPIQSIRAIIVSGGGSLQSQYVSTFGDVVKTSEPMSYYITSALKSICDGVEVESYGDSPRLANITGLYIRAKFEMQKRAKSTASVEQTA